MTQNERKKIAAEAWRQAMPYWNNPYIPSPVLIDGPEDIEAAAKRLGGQASAAQIGEEMGFMDITSFQTYMNLPRIEEGLGDLRRGAAFVSAHEAGHRYCPYDEINSFLLNESAKEALRRARPDLKDGADSIAPMMLNLFTDTCDNTSLVQSGDEDVAWAYSKIAGMKGENSLPKSALGRVYLRSLERIWDAELFEPGVRLNDKEAAAADSVARIFTERNPMNIKHWKGMVSRYASILAPFIESPEECEGMSNSVDNTGAASVPSKKRLKEIEGDIARKLAETDSNGLPTNPNAPDEFRRLLDPSGVGTERGSGGSRRSVIPFYDALSDNYSVRFASRPSSRFSTIPFSTARWMPDDPADELDVYRTLIKNGYIIPGVTTRKQTYRMRGLGTEEAVPNLDIFIDCSGSMPDPGEEMSWAVLASFVASKRALAKGASERVVSFSGSVRDTGRTSDPAKVYEALIFYENGGTVFPARLLAQPTPDEPKLALIVTDTDISNHEETADAIRKFTQRDPRNCVTIYATREMEKAEYLAKAGAECVRATGPEVFRHILGKTEEAYMR